MRNKQLYEAFRLRFEYYNLYENKEEKWHKKYKNHDLYKVVIKSFDYGFKEIGIEMPKIFDEFNLAI